MQGFALWVEFDIVPGRLAAFLEAGRLDADGSVGNEPGCRRFDVLQDTAVPDRVCFYEVYDDEAAFLRHRETPHFKTYLATTEPMITAKKVTFLRVEQRGKA
ncbi:MAG: antibiotic biosynthesis monooxygenase [Casimicrobiaceae bacterium]